MMRWCVSRIRRGTWIAWWGVLYALSWSYSAPLNLPPGSHHAPSPVPPVPSANPLIELGRTLFFDPRFSRDGTIRCASCHQPERAFADGMALAVGVDGVQGTRNTPSLRHVTSTTEQLWDGRRPSLEAQMLAPFTSPSEHGLGDQRELISRVQGVPEYEELFRMALQKSGRDAQLDDIATALSAYVRSLQSMDTPLDRYLYGHDVTALEPTAQRGLELFRGRAQCATCHLIGPHQAPLTDGKYHSLVLGFDRLAPQLATLTRLVVARQGDELDRLIASHVEVAALGRFVVTRSPGDIGKFRTPSLRNVAATAPYMHDGSIMTLDEALEREIYYRGQASGHPLILSVTERAALLAFLRALTEASPVQLPQ